VEQAAGSVMNAPAQMPHKVPRGMSGTSG